MEAQQAQNSRTLERAKQELKMAKGNNNSLMLNSGAMANRIGEGNSHQPMLVATAVSTVRGTDIRDIRDKVIRDKAIRDKVMGIKEELNRGEANQVDITEILIVLEEATTATLEDKNDLSYFHFERKF